MGPHGAAAAVLAGAQGVVYDSQLAMMHSNQISREMQNIFRGLNGSETAVAGGYRFLRHKLLPDVADEASREEVLGLLSQPGKLLPAEVDLALAELFQALYQDASSLVQATEESIDGHLRKARRDGIFAAGSAFAREYGLHYPFVQGPMAHVSDRPGFAAAVADA